MGEKRLSKGHEDLAQSLAAFQAQQAAAGPIERKGRSGASETGVKEPVKELVGETKLRVLGQITEDERQMLQFANDPVEVVSYWTCWSFTQMRQDNWFSVHPAICSRVFQELSKGTLGYWQASKLIYVPFPFPFAQ